MLIFGLTLTITGMAMMLWAAFYERLPRIRLESDIVLTLPTAGDATAFMQDYIDVNGHKVTILVDPTLLHKRPTQATDGEGA